MSRILPIALACGLLAAAAPAAAQPTVMNATCDEKDWHGEDNEFGKICMKFQDSMVGAPVKAKAVIELHRTYQDRDAAYFLFAFLAEGTPFKVSNVRLTTADGKELPVFQRQDDGKAVKIIIDVADLPPAESELHLTAVVDSCDRGLYQLGALVQPFNYRWQRIVMGSGEPADVYSFTQVGVNQASCKGGIAGLPKVDVPSGGLVGAIAALGLVAVAARRARQP